MNPGLWGYLTILAAVAAIVFAACVFVYIGRLEIERPHPWERKSEHTKRFWPNCASANR